MANRTEENQELCEKWDNMIYSGTNEQVTVKLLIAQNNFLEDISKSLARIADLQFITTNPITASLFSNEYFMNIDKAAQMEDNDGK